MSAESKIIYGMTKDGRMTPCRANDPSTCRYHVHNVPHVAMTKEQAVRENERLSAAAFGGVKMKDSTLSKANVIDASVRNTSSVISLTDADLDRIESTANERSERLENRTPMTNATDFVDIPDIENLQRHNGWPTSDHAELVWMTKHYGPDRDLRGLPLKPGERAAITEAIGDLDAFRPNHDGTRPSPLKSALVSTLAYDPTITKDDAMKTATDIGMMSDGASILVDSPYVDDDVRKAAFETSPSSALESPMLDSSCVNQMFTDDNPYARRSAQTPPTAILKALHHPNADPDKAYEYVRNHPSDAAEWTITLNPNDDFINRVKDLNDADPGAPRLFDEDAGPEGSEWSAFLD